MRAWATLLLTLFAPATAAAQLSIVDTEPLRLDLGAYVSTFSGYQRTPYDTAGLSAPASGSNAAVLRLEWKAGIADFATVDVHNRAFWSLSSTGTGFGAIGLGSTVPPTRTINLRSELVNEYGMRFEHDLDRLAVTFFTPVADITVGRQAVSWGNSTIFTLGDLWTQFSPFELDTSQKRGVDAVRFLAYPGGVELDVIVVDRGEWEDLSGGARAGWSLGDADYYTALAKNYDTAWWLLGFGVDLGSGRLHGELGQPLALNLERAGVPAALQVPRATVGFDWLPSAKFTAFAEYHLNGPGTKDTSRYLLRLTTPEFARGETYFLGKHYAGIGASYMPWDDLVTFTLAGIGNLTDPSMLLTPSIAYALAQNVSATLGGYFGLGKYPEISFDPDNPAITSFAVHSEYGLYGNTVFLQLAGYF